MFDARLMLEIGSLEAGIESLTPDLVAELEEINRQMPKSVRGTTYEGYAEFVALNARFHDAIVKLSGNKFIIDAHRRLGYHQRITQALHGRGVPDLVKIVAEHKAIIAALKRRSIDDARAALRNHIVGAAKRLYDSEPPNVPAAVQRRGRKAEAS
jgi:DNA-binding GntR family transcriptional regulator